MNNIATVAPTVRAGFWHRFWVDLVSIFHSPATQAAVDVGLAASGSAAAIPVANTALVGVGELLDAAHQATVTSPPGTPLTTAAIAANLNLSAATLDTLSKTVALGAPKVAAQVEKAAQGTAAVAAVATAAAQGEQGVNMPKEDGPRPLIEPATN